MSTLENLNKVKPINIHFNTAIPKTWATVQCHTSLMTCISSLGTWMVQDCDEHTGLVLRLPQWTSSKEVQVPSNFLLAASASKWYKLLLLPVEMCWVWALYCWHHCLCPACWRLPPQMPTSQGKFAAWWCYPTTVYTDPATYSRGYQALADLSDCAARTDGLATCSLSLHLADNTNALCYAWPGPRASLVTNTYCID